MHVCFCTIAAGLHPYFMTIKGFGCLHFPKSSTVICIHFAIFLCNMPQCNGSQLMGHYPKMGHQSVKFNSNIRRLKKETQTSEALCPIKLFTFSRLLAQILRPLGRSFYNDANMDWHCETCLHPKKYRVHT